MAARSVRIEPARIGDMAAIYRTSLATAISGEDASALHRDPDLQGHVYAGPYIDQGSGTQLVVLDDGGVAGYLVSTDDTHRFEAWAEASWWPPLRSRYALIDGASREAQLVRHIHEPPQAPTALATDFPAHFHIDLERRVRGQGLGRELIERLLVELRERGVAGVHLGADESNTNAVGFYEHLGFHEVGREPDGILMGLRLTA